MNDFLPRLTADEMAMIDAARQATVRKLGITQ
jgi:hypothetical protein